MSSWHNITGGHDLEAERLLALGLVRNVHSIHGIGPAGRSYQSVELSERGWQIIKYLDDRALMVW